MSPYPLDPARSTGPMRLVLTTFPSPEAAQQVVEDVLKGKLAACANLVPARSRYWWQGQLESADEVLVIFKTVPKRVGALFRWIQEHHPYDVPELVELDVPRAGSEYLDYLTSTLDPRSRTPGSATAARRRGAPRGPGARVPGRIRAPHRRRSR